MLIVTTNNKCKNIYKGVVKTSLPVEFYLGGLTRTRLQITSTNLPGRVLPMANKKICCKLKGKSILMINLEVLQNSLLAHTRAYTKRL